MATIVIDPGHGGTHDLPGSRANTAVGAGGMLEKTLTLDIGRRVADLLAQSGHNVHLTRNRDANVSAGERARVARDKRAAVFLSIHFNASHGGGEQGTKALVRPHVRGGVDAPSRRLAEAVVGELSRELGLPARGLRAAPWSVLNERLHHSATARCISEVSFLSDPAEERRLASPAYRERVARALARAVGRSLAERALPRALDSDWCQIRNSIIQTALDEETFWTRPDGTVHEESDPEMLDRLRAYWRDGVGDANWNAQAIGSANDKVAWSAAFVSWVARTAGVPAGAGFAFSGLHLEYIVQALRNREASAMDKPFWFYGMDEQDQAQPKPGDILCANRGASSFTYSSLRSRFLGNSDVPTSGETHCNIVVGVCDRGGRKFLEVIGGNRLAPNVPNTSTHGVTVRSSHEIEVNDSGVLLNPGAQRIFGMIGLVAC